MPAVTFTNYLENALLNHTFGGTAYTAPTTIFVGLLTAVSDAEAGTVTEISSGNYQRASVTNNSTNFPNASSSVKSNGTTITFGFTSGTTTTYSGTVTHLGIYDASTSGNLLIVIDIPNVIIDTGDPAPTIASSGLSFTLDNGFSHYLNGKWLDLVLGAQSYSPSANIGIDLFTVAPSAAAGTGGTLVSGGSYARLSVTNNTTNFPNATAGAKTNGADFTFTSSADYTGAVVAYGFYDAGSSGNFLGRAVLGSTKNINSGSAVRILTGDFDLALN